MLNKFKKILKQNKGFTLVEVVVASTIVVIVSVMLVYAFVAAAGVNTRANEIKQATRGFDNDIHMGVEENSDRAVAELNLGVTRSDGEPLELAGSSTEFRMPMNVYTFVDQNTGDRQMLVFRNPSEDATP